MAIHMDITSQNTAAKDAHASLIDARLAAVLISVGVFMLTLAISGCNTTEGIGEDMQAAGESLSEEAEDAN